MSRWEFTITDDNRASMARLSVDVIQTAPVGYVMSVAEGEKSRAQENKFSAMVRDISKTCTFMGRKWDFESWKRLLIDAYVAVKREEARALGLPDPFAEHGHTVASLDGERVVQLGVQSRGFKKKQASDFIEYLYYYGANQDVTWSTPSKWAIEEWRSAKPASSAEPVPPSC